VSFQDVLVANKRLKGRVTHTPTIHSPVLSEETNAQVYFKMEALQKTGSFKVRGALNKIDSLTDEAMSSVVITASAGNHAARASFREAIYAGGIYTDSFLDYDTIADQSKSVLVALLEITAVE